MPDNIFPDRSNSGFDIKYNQLKILASDLIARLLNRGVVTSHPVGQPQTGDSGGDDTPNPPGSGGCRLIYVANLSQASTNNPQALIYENTIGPIVWTRISTGVYRGTLTDAFPLGNTWVMVNTNYLKAIDDKQVKFNVTANDDYVEIQTESGGVLSDDVLDHTSIEIRTYCIDVEEEAPVFEIVMNVRSDVPFTPTFRFFRDNSLDMIGSVDWGDGNTDSYNEAAGASFYDFTHSFTPSGTETFVIRWTFTEQLAIQEVDNSYGSTDFDLLSMTYTARLINLALQRVIDFSTIEYNDGLVHAILTGYASSVNTVIDLSVLAASVTSIEILFFPLLTTVNNTPATVTHIIHLGSNFALTDVTGTLPPADTQIFNFSTGLNMPALDLSLCTTLELLCGFNSSQVDSILAALVANGLPNGTADLRQSPAAPPGAGGLTDKATLIGNGWTVTTD
jgi:hypothetical protein